MAPRLSVGSLLAPVLALVAWAAPGAGEGWFSLNPRRPDGRAADSTLQSRGAVFLTPPFESPWEVRCFFRDPDGHLLELSEARPAAGS